MTTLPSREELQEMMYRDLQKLCKDWGVPANLKSGEMIDLLLNAQSEDMPSPSPPPLPPPTRQRSVSTRYSSRTGPSRVTSVIVHDTSQPSFPPERKEVGSDTNNSTKPSPSNPPLPRTRKAKELQRKLGVGRPVAVGGTGPRAVTRSSTLSRERRLRSSRSIKQTEATIHEGKFPARPLLSSPNHSKKRKESETIDESPSRQTDPSPDPQRITSAPRRDRLIDQGKEPDAPDYPRLISEAIKPLQEQIEVLKAEVRQMQNLQFELNELRHQVGQMDILSVEVKHLTAEVQNVRARLDIQGQTLQHLPSNPSTPPSSLRSHQIPRDVWTSTKSPHSTPHPGVAPVLLGKRQRELSADDTPVTEGVEKQKSPRAVSSPSKKRLKLASETPKAKGKEAIPEEPSDTEESVASRDRATSAGMPRVTSFIVYNDPEDEEEQLLDSPPPTTLLPEFFVSHSAGPSADPNSPNHARSTSSANASENQNPFNFSFLPAPGPALFMPTFPYPEPPQSPTPAGTSLAGSLGISTSERTDVFKTFGLPPPDRARRLPTSGTLSNNTIDPAALSQRNPSGKQRDPSSNEVGAGLGLLRPSPEEPGSNPERDTPVVKRTMYGTELEGDTRFGDFGVEGVATGFWAGGRF